jgi:acetate kinase
MNILLLNAGSSSLKGTLVESTSRREVARGLADWAGSTVRYEYVAPDGKTVSEEVHWKGHAQAVHRFVSDLFNHGPKALPNHSDLRGVGHRIVHGGPFTSSVRITPEIRARIAALAELAPLHNPPSLDTLAAAEEELPRTPHVAVFDTAFHSTLPPEAHTYPVPAQWTDDWGIKRFGFHGLSYAYCAKRAAEMLKRPLHELRLVICHLGNGCSAAAVQGGRSIDTTMGFTPLEGLMMGTRSGSIDPSIVLIAQTRHGLSAEQVETVLNRESGLLGVTGISSDMRQVLKAVSEGHEKAQLAVAVYTHRVRQAIGAFAVTMGGIDALVFTAGVGEHAAEVRRSVCSGLECLGLYLDSTLNGFCKPDADIADRSSRGRILVIATREDMTMLDEVMHVLGEKSTDGGGTNQGGVP